MGNGQSRDGFAGVLPSTPADKASKSDPPSISVAWTADSREDKAKQPIEQDRVGNVPPVFIEKIVPPGHALQLEETSRLSLEASEVIRAFNNVGQTPDRFEIPESVRKSRTLDAYADVCSEILPGFLYVSNLRVARNSAKLREIGITHVINCCGELKHYQDGVEQPAVSSDAKFNILKLFLRDDANEDLTPFFPKVIEYISTCRKRNQSKNKEKDKTDKVLIHCHQGVSRSCAFAIAYVMLENLLSYHEAAALVKRRRAISSPNTAFICQLLEWEKDLQAMAARDNEKAGLAMGVLLRLAPHSMYDPETIVLKRCYEPAADAARQRQNIARIRTTDDKHRLLWSSGTFVFQSPSSPTDLIVWHGSKCEIPDAVSTATKLARHLLHVQTLILTSDAATMQIKVIEVREHAKEHTGTNTDHFEYAAELQWSRESLPKTPALLLPTDGNEEVQTDHDNSVPQLFMLNATDERGDEDLWEQITNYDSEDLIFDSAFLLCVMQPQGLVEGYVWIGSGCKFTADKVVQAALKRVQKLFPSLPASPIPTLIIELQDEESDAFWELYEAGY